MNHSALYLACYDVTDDHRLRDALHVLRDYALGRQKSVFECPLETEEHDQLLARINRVLESSEDRFILLRLDRRSAMQAIGRGVVVEDGDIFYIG